jgi:hypothetical protein
VSNLGVLSTDWTGGFRIGLRADLFIISPMQASPFFNVPVQRMR